MDQEIKTVLIAGATGTLGPPLIAALSPHFTLTILSRTGSTPKFPPHIRTISSEYTETSLLPLLRGQDAVISLLRSQHLSATQSLIRASAAANVKRFIPGEFGSNSASPAARDAVPIFGKKWVIHDLLVEKEKEGGMSWTGVICGAFFDWGLREGFLGFSLTEQKAMIYDRGDVKCQLSVLEDIALAVRGILKSPRETGNRYVFINTFHLSQREILEVLERVSGREWDRVGRAAGESMRMGLERLKEREREGRPFDNELMEEVLRAAHWSEVEGMDYEEEELWNERLGLPKRELDEVVRRVLEG